MTDILVAMFAFLIIATCARSYYVRGVGWVFAIVFFVIGVVGWLAGAMLGGIG